MKFTLESGAARAFAADWIEAWNARDLERVLSHFADDAEFSSPFVASVAGESSGLLKGKQALSAYWTKALGLLPPFHFELISVLLGANWMTILYRGHRGEVAESLQFDSSLKVRFATSCYAIQPLGEP